MQFSNQTSNFYSFMIHLTSTNTLIHSDRQSRNCRFNTLEEFCFRSRYQFLCEIKSRSANKVNKKNDFVKLKLVSVYPVEAGAFFIFSSNDSLLIIMKNAFYFIYKALLVPKIFKFRSSVFPIKSLSATGLYNDPRKILKFMTS